MRLLRFLLNTSRRTVILAIVFGVISGVSTAALLALIGTVLVGSRLSPTTLLLGFVGLCLVSPVSRFISDFTLNRLGYASTCQLRIRLSRQILATPLRRLEQIGSGRLFAALTDDISTIINALLFVPMLCVNLAVVIGCLIYLGWLSFTVLLIVLGFMGLGVITYQVPLLKGAHLQRLARERMDALFDHFRALTDGSKELKLHGRRREAFLSKTLQPTAESLRSYNVMAMSFFIFAVSWGQVLFFLFAGTVLFVLPHYTTISNNVLTACTITALYMIHPLDIIVTILPNLSRARVALEKVESLGLSLVGADSLDNANALHESTLCLNSLELSSVTYTYHREQENSNFTLGPINLRLLPGELVFLIGGNGSGKTTLLKLLTGLYAPEGGEMRLNGKAITSSTQQQYCEYFSVVFFDYYLFESLLGLETRNLDGRASHYLSRLHLDHKVKVKDGVLSTTELSQGQRKRLALLVAYLEDRPIYVFDEWAADQDPQFKELFYHDLVPELMSRNKTVIIISHDDHYYDQADRIIKLDNGQIEYDRRSVLGRGETISGTTPARVTGGGAETANASARDETSDGVSLMEETFVADHTRPHARLNLTGAGLHTSILTFLFIAAFVVLALYQDSPPRPADASASPAEFSVARARRHVEVLSQKTHPMGTLEHAAVRNYIMGELAAQGLEAEVQKTSVVAFGGGLSYRAGTVENVIARLKGQGSGNAILLVGHYDSVPTSFGASDDGAAIAAMLESLRALKATAPLKNDVIFLFTDGEETGSMGANAFADQHPWAKDVGLVLNMEARGNSGPVLMFETSDQNGWLVRELARSAPHPVTNSLLYEIYRALPNDTDLSVFKRKGYAGLNFAFIDGHAHYHSLADNLDHLDMRSLQHQGANALALVRHFGNLDLKNPRADNVVYFSIFGALLVYYSGLVSIVLTVIVLLLFIGVLVLGFRRSLLSVGGLFVGGVALLASLIISALAVSGVWRLIRFLHPAYGSILQGVTYNSNLYIVSFVALASAVTSVVYILFRKKVREANLIMGGLLWWALLMVLTTIAMRGASYVFTWPLLFALVAMAYLFLSKDQNRISLSHVLVLCLSSVAGIVLLSPLIYLIFTAMPLDLAGGVSVLVVLLLGLLIPHLSMMTAEGKKKWWLPAGLLAVSLAFIIAGKFTSDFNKDRPQPNNIFYSFNADTGRAIWGSTDERPDQWTQQFFASGADKGGLRDYVPSRYDGFLRSDAPVTTLITPTIALLDDRTADGVRTVRLHVTSPRQAPFISLEIDPQIEVMAAQVDGKPLDPGNEPAPARNSRAWTLLYFAPPTEGFDLSVATKSSAPLKIVMIDQSYELPASVLASIKPRPDYMIPTPYPYNPFGDSTFVTKSFTF